MEINSIHRPGLKKPRLAEAEDPIDRNMLMNKYLAANERDREGDTESFDSGRGSFPQQQQIQELVVQYKAALAELTTNSKPIITNLTIIAGENQHAAKAVAATVCANILEVPSDRKLPSLYLLDSIVKNIGRDYIKYFGARLPEVFCKAYREVDPSTHPGMLHLFRTWKGVFAPQPLQMIAKELGFPPTANGSSSGSATSRSGSQSQRPAQSIHVNPEYLEARQRLQQPSKTKGLIYDSSVTMVNSPQDAKRLDRAVGASSGRQWPEPTLKTQISQRQRAPNEFVREKNIVAAYGSYDHDSDHSSQSGLEIGRVKESIIDKPWYGVDKNVDDKMSIRRNGLDIKQSFANYANPAAVKTNMHLMPRKINSGKSVSRIDESWKNSDEEEYMWDHLNSKSSDHHSTGISQGHRWTPEEANRSGLENGQWRPQSLHEIGSRVDREASADTLSTERKDQAHYRNRRSPSWTEEPHSTADPHLGVSVSANSLTRAPIPSHTSPSHTGNSNLGFLTNPGLVPSVSVGQKRRFVSDYIADQDYHQPPLSHSPDIDKSQISMIQSKRSQFSHPQDTLAANSPEFPSQNTKPSNPMVHSVPPRHHIPVAEPSSQYQRSLLPKIEASANISSSLKSLSNQSSKINVADSIVKNEILAKKSVTKSKQKNQPKVTRPDPRLSAGSSKTQPSQAKLSASTVRSQIKTEESPLPHGQPPSPKPSDTASDPMTNLFSTLMAKGLITASKSVSPTSSVKLTSTQPTNRKPSTVNTSLIPVNSIPAKPIKKVSPDTNESPKTAADCSVEEVKPLIGLEFKPETAAKSTAEEVKPFIGLEFKPDLIRQSHPSVISGLFDDLPHQCELCGLKLKLPERFERHLEWHASRKSEVNFQEKNSRRWFANQENWVAGIDVTCFEDTTSEEELEEREMMVPADESQCVCLLCGEIFEDVYSHKTDEWMFKGAVYLGVPLTNSMTGTSSENASKGPIVHSNCISENSLKDLGFPGVI